MSNNKQQINGLISPKKIIGWYRLGTNKPYCSIAFATYIKPNLIKRFFMRTLLDFYWIKEEQQ